MTCKSVTLPGGTAIVCHGRGRRWRCRVCFAAGGFQCDWKVGPKKTCDVHLCPEHAVEVGENKHLCPLHAEAYEEWKKARATA